MFSIGLNGTFKFIEKEHLLLEREEFIVTNAFNAYGYKNFTVHAGIVGSFVTVSYFLLRLEIHHLGSNGAYLVK